MYPSATIFGIKIDFYSVFLCVGVVAAILTVRILSDKRKIYWKLQNFCVISAVVSVLVGYFSAVLFQALYNIERNGGFVLNKSTGATFYGGLIGGTACFLLIYFGIGYFLFKKDAKIIAFKSWAWTISGLYSLTTFSALRPLSLNLDIFSKTA